MKVFFAGSSQGLPEYREIYEQILGVLKERGEAPLDSWIVEILNNRPDTGTSSKELLIKQLDLIRECDYMVVEATTPSFGIGYLMHEALYRRKPILCLYPESLKIQPLSDLVKGSTSSLLSLKRYTPQNLQKVISNFCQSQLEQEDLYKFNFLATGDILDYIEKGAKKEGKSKSEFLRDKIKLQLIQD